MGRRRGEAEVSCTTLISLPALPADMLLRLVIVAVAASSVVLAVPLDDAESRQIEAGAGGATAGAGTPTPPPPAGSPQSNFTIAAEDLDKIVEEIRDQLGLAEAGEDTVFNVPSYTSSIGNIIYSTGGFVLGGLLFFVSIFDVTRKPVIAFFDQVFGERSARRRRDVSEGLDARVAAAFQVFTAAVDKMNAILILANEFKK